MKTQNLPGTTSPTQSQKTDTDTLWDIVLPTSNMYPTKQQILKKRPNIKPQTIQTIKKWKTYYLKKWKKLTKSQKITALHTLILNILQNYPKKIKINIQIGNYYQYDPETKTIYLQHHNPSIISTLHELAHHLHGSSELKACRWSIWIFKEYFPGLYKKLTWEGHMLTK